MVWFDSLHLLSLHVVRHGVMMSVVAVELYVEIEGLLGNKLFLATELSSVGPVAYEVLSFLLLCGLAD